MHFKIVDTSVFASTEGENIMSFFAGVSKFLASRDAKTSVDDSPVASNEKNIANDDFIHHQHHIDINNYYQAEGLGLNDFDGDNVPDIY